MAKNNTPFKNQEEKAQGWGMSTNSWTANNPIETFNQMNNKLKDNAKTAPNKETKSEESVDDKSTQKKEEEELQQLHDTKKEAEVAYTTAYAPFKPIQNAQNDWLNNDWKMTEQEKDLLNHVRSGEKTQKVTVEDYKKYLETSAKDNNSEKKKDDKKDDISIFSKMIKLTGSKDWNDYLENYVSDEHYRTISKMELGSTGKALLEQMRVGVGKQEKKRRIANSAEKWQAADAREKEIYDRIVTRRADALKDVDAKDYKYSGYEFKSEDKELESYMKDLYFKAEAEALSRVYNNDELNTIKKNKHTDAAPSFWDKAGNAIVDFATDIGAFIGGSGAYEFNEQRKAERDTKITEQEAYKNSVLKVIDAAKEIQWKKEHPDEEYKSEIKDGVGKWALKQVEAGAAQFNKAISSSLDLIIPSDFLGKYDLFSNLNEIATKDLEYYSTEAYKSSASRGKAWHTMGDILTGTVAAVPNAILAYLTVGYSLGATGATIGSSAITQVSTASALKGAVSTMLKKPAYWTSVLQTLGTDYEEAKKRGANDFVAVAAAILTTAVNAGVEVGSGIEELAANLKNGGSKSLLEGIIGWVKSSLEEGGEEVVQGIVSNATAAMLLDNKAPIFSLTDDTAIINPVKTAKEFGMGVAVGAVLGGAQTGGQIAVSSAIEAKNITKTGDFYNSPDVVKALIETGLESPKNSQSYQLAEKMSKSKSSPSSYEVGKLFYANVEQIATEEKASSKSRVSEGDVYRNTKTGDIVTILSRDDDFTKASIATKNGTIEKEYTNGQIDLIVTNKNYETVTKAPVVEKNAEENTHAAPVEAPVSSAEQTQTVAGSNVTESNVQPVSETESDKPVYMDDKGTLFFQQNDIDTSDNTVREGSFFIQNAKESSGRKEVSGFVVGRYGVHQVTDALFTVTHLQSGLRMAQIETRDEALKLANYLNDNVEFNDVQYTLVEGKGYAPLPTAESKQFVADVKRIVAEKPYLAEAVEAVETESVSEKKEAVEETVVEDKKNTPMVQLVENYEGAVDDVLNATDAEAKECAENRVAIKVLEHTPNVILNNVEDAKDLRVIINYTKLYLALRKEGIIEGHYHNLGAEIGKKLPEFLTNPDAIVRLDNGKLNFFITVKTEKGNNGIISVELNSTKDIDGKYEDYNVIVTFFPTGDKYTKNLIKKSVEVEYKREDLPQVNPQLYEWLAIVNGKPSTLDIIQDDAKSVNSEDIDKKADVGSQVPNGSSTTPQLQTSETPLDSSSASNNSISNETKVVKGDGLTSEKTDAILEDRDSSNEVTVYTTDNVPVKVRYRVVSADELLASNAADGTVNKNYPQNLQPRDRTREASKRQIREMANNIQPERLGESANVSDGAPIVGSDMVVESGNGRVLAIREMYRMGKGDGYVDYIKKNAEKFGIDITHMPEKPVLVRERVSEVDREEFVKKANESGLSSVSTTERAKLDAAKLTSDILDLFVPNEEGYINTAENKSFIQAVISNVFVSNELNSVVDAMGNLSATGLERITNAVFYKAYGDDSLTARLSESTDNDIKNVTKVLLNVAPRVAKIKSDIDAGNLYDIDFSEDIVSAVKLFIHLKNSKMTVSAYIAQVNLIDDYSDIAIEFANVFEQKNRGSKQATEIFNIVLDMVEGLGNPNQISLMSTKILTKEEIIHNAISEFNRRDKTRADITLTNKGEQADRRGTQAVSDAETAYEGIRPREKSEVEGGDRSSGQKNSGHRRTEEIKIAVGDVFVSNTDEKTYRIIERTNDTTNVEVTAGSNKDILTMSNSTADEIFVGNDGLVKVESAEKETQPVKYDTDFFKKLKADINKGEAVTVKEVQDAVDALILNHGEAVKADLMEHKVAELNKLLSWQDRGRCTRKAEMIDAIYSDLVDAMYFAVSGENSISYVFDGSSVLHKVEKMLYDASRALTEDGWKSRLAKYAETYQKAKAEKEAKYEKIKNPTTADEFAQKKRLIGLSEEEEVTFEKLYAEERKKSRESKNSEKTKVADTDETFLENSDNYIVEKTTNTKTGEDLWVVRLKERLETDEWKKLNEQMKALGGYYSKYTKGWNFKKNPTATLSNQEEVETDAVKSRTPAEKLRKVADGMQKAIDDKFRDRLTNTAKRARQAASSEAEGERLKTLQATIYNIAEAIEGGKETLLDKIDSKAQVETLLRLVKGARRNKIFETMQSISYSERLEEESKPYINDDIKYAEYPLTIIHENILIEYVRACEGKKGYTKAAARLKKALSSAKKGYVQLNSELFADIDKIVKNLSTTRDDYWNEMTAERKRLARMGIEDVRELRAYLREFITYLPGRDIEAEKQRSIKEKERQLANSKIEGFFPTPKVIVERMLEEADIKPGERVLEPSAGKGNIADAVKASHPDNALDVVEWNTALSELLSEKGHNVVGKDFLQHAGSYDKIIMNPPFENGQDIDHIKHAHELLNEGGRVVCIMSEGPFYRSDKKATEFREWLEEVGGVSEKLPEGSFKSAERSTGVNTRLVVIDKPVGDVSYSLESEESYGKAGDLLSSGDGGWSTRESGKKPTQKVDGRSSRYKEGRKTKHERREYCKALKTAGYTREEIVNGHKCEVIPEEHYDGRMRKLVAKNKADGIDTTVIITGQAQLPFINKFAKGILIRENGKATMIVQWDNDFVMPEQISDHEKVHRDYNTQRVQKIKNIFKNSLSLADRMEIIDRLSSLYNGVIEGNEEKIFEEFIADVLSGMDTFGYSRIYQDLVNAYWRGDDVFIDNFKVAEYTESTDTGDSHTSIATNTTLRVFPPYNESHSDANERATRWAHNEAVEVGAQKMISYHDNWYVIEKFDSADLGYQIVGVVSASDVDRFVEEVMERERRIERTKQGASAGLVDSSKEGNSVSLRGHVSDNNANKYGKQVEPVQKLDRNKSGERTVSDDNRRSAEQDGTNWESDSQIIDYSLDTDGSYELDELIELFGEIEPGEKPVRDVHVPKKISKNRYVSKFARTMMEAEVTPGDALSEFEARILDGTLTHEPITNDKARESAVKDIKHLGFDGALNKWQVLSDSGKVGKNELALGMELYNQCITNKDAYNAMKIVAELVAEATRAGQTLQACRMLKLMTPDGQLYYLEKSIEKMNEEFRESLGEKFKDIELDEDLMRKFMEADGEEARSAAYDALCQNIADQIPATMRDKWNSWRYLAMLGNTRTHIRNIVGNAVFVPAVRMKTYVGAVLERVFKVDTAERTKSLFKSKEAIEFAKSDFEEMQKVLQGENAKYAVTNDIEGKRTIYNTRWLEAIRTKNFEWLEKEDIWFLKAHYVDALARLLTVRKIDLNNITADNLEKIRAIAVREAQAATYRDANALADALTKLERGINRSGNKPLKIAGFVLEGIMPFKKTPLNIAKQGVAYSPVGILSAVYKGAKKLQDGKAYSATDVIEDLSKGLTGTAIMALGMFLAGMGWISGGDDEDKKKKAFDKMVGEQSYALKFRDNSYTIDWMTPSCLPLFTGVELFELTKDEFSFRDMMEAIGTLTEPLLELSVFSGISDAIATAQYNSTNELMAVLTDAVSSYFMQALPTVGGQASRIIDSTKREYYFKDRDSELPTVLQGFIGQAASKIPFASFLFAPSIDDWGREETYGNVFERVFENTVSPGYYSKQNYTDVDYELRRLYAETGDNSVFPIEQKSYYQVDGVRYNMKAEIAAAAKKTRGQISFKLVNDLISSKFYQKMTDEEKVKAIANCYTQAGKQTNAIMLESVKSGKIADMNNVIEPPVTASRSKIEEIYSNTGDDSVTYSQVKDKFVITGYGTETTYRLSKEDMTLLQNEYERIVDEKVQQYLSLSKTEALSDDKWVDVLTDVHAEAMQEAQSIAIDSGWYESKEEEPITKTDEFAVFKGNIEENEMPVTESFWLFLDAVGKDYIMPDWENPTPGQKILAETYAACDEEPESLLLVQKDASFSENKVKYILNEEQHKEFQRVYEQYYWNAVEGMKNVSAKDRVKRIKKARDTASDRAKEYILKTYRGQLQTEK